MVTTPAYVPFVRDPTDVVGRRIAAAFIDWGIALVMLIALALSLGQTREYGSVARAEIECDRINDFTDDFCIPVNDIIYVYDGGDMLAMLALPLLYFFLNDALLTGVTGFSIGKGIVGLRVIRQSDGRLCGLGRSCGRWAMWIADAQPCGLPLVGLITGLASKGHRRVGDMVAGTLVVDKRDVGTVPIVPGLTQIAPAPGSWGQPTAWGPPPQWGAPPPQSPSPWGAPPPPTWGAPPPPSAPPPGPPQWGAPPQSPAPWGAPPPAAPPSVPSPASGWQHPEPQWQQPSWDQPTAAVPDADASMAAQAGVDGPIWDDARDTYIQWDPDLSSWVQWDEAAREWRRIV